MRAPADDAGTGTASLSEKAVTSESSAAPLLRGVAASGQPISELAAIDVSPRINGARSLPESKLQREKRKYC
jgi:hypothetical protein